MLKTSRGRGERRRSGAPQRHRGAYKSRALHKAANPQQKIYPGHN